MRVPHPVHYRQITEALTPGACPLCVVLRDFQASCIRESDLQAIDALCNYHTWALAGVAQAESTASLFLRLLETATLDCSTLQAKPCGICQRVHDEESKRLDEFAEKLAHEKFREWMNLRGAVCLPHAARLLPRLPGEQRQELANILERRMTELKRELVKLVRDANSGERGHEGVLGRVAEVLAAQRNLP